MLIELGHYCLILAFALALAQSVLPFAGALRNDTSLMAVGAPVAVGQFLLVGLSFAALIQAYVTRISPSSTSSRTPTRRSRSSTR